MDLIDDATGQRQPLPEPERRLKRILISEVGFAHLLFSHNQWFDRYAPRYSFDGLPADYKVERVFHDLRTSSFVFVVSYPTFARVAEGETIPGIPVHVRIYRVAVAETRRPPGTLHATLPEGGRLTYRGVTIPAHRIDAVPADLKGDLDALLVPLGSGPASLTPPTEEKPVNFREWL